MKLYGDGRRRRSCHNDLVGARPRLVFISLIVASVLASDISFPNITLSKIAFGSCHKRKYAVRHDLPNGVSSLWDAIAQQDPDVFLWTGDAIYPPKRGIASVELLQAEYQQMITNTTLGYANFQPRFGMHGTWDDHDYGGNDMGSDMPDKPARAKVFLDFIQKRTTTPDNKNNQNDQPTVSSSSLSSIPPHRQGVYQSIEFGVAPHKVKIILLDTRWHRTSHCIPSVATNLPLGAGIACVTRWLTAGLAIPCQEPEHAMLGKEQWDWLEGELQTSDAQLHVVVSSVQVLTTNPVMESWGHYPKERRRLIHLLHGTSGVVVLSGDVHHAEILNPNAYQYTKESSSSARTTNTASFLEVTSSGLTHECSKHIYGALCQPLLDIFSEHRYRGSGDDDSSIHNQHDNNNNNKYYYIGRNYGMIQVDWEQQTFQVNVHSLETTATAKSESSDSAFNQVVLTTGPRSFASSTTGGLDVDRVIPCLDGHLIPMLKRFVLTLLGVTVLSILFGVRLLRKKQLRP